MRDEAKSGRKGEREKVRMKERMKERIKNGALSFLRALPLIICAFFMLIYFFSGRDISAESLLNFAPENPFYAAIFLILLYAFKSLTVFFPIVVLNILGGFLFDPLDAVVVNTIGVLVELTVPYWVGRFSGAAYADRLCRRHKKLGELMAHLRTGGGESNVCEECAEPRCAETHSAENAECVEEPRYAKSRCAEDVECAEPRCAKSHCAKSRCAENTQREEGADSFSPVRSRQSACGGQGAQVVQDKQSARDGQVGRDFFTSFFLRVIACLPGDAVSMYFGAVRMPFGICLLGSFLGTFPSLVATTLLGMSITDPTSPMFWLSVGLTVFVSIMTVVICRVWKSIKERKSNG